MAGTLRSGLFVLGAGIALLSAGRTLATAADPEQPEAAFDLSAWLDERFEAEWRAANIDPEKCDDATYLRRVYLDLVGRIPSISETRDFLSREEEDRREQVVDSLIIDPANSGENTELHAEQLARVWRRFMLPPSTANAGPMGRPLEAWLAGQLRENLPYDELTRRILLGQDNAEDDQTGATMYFGAVGGMPENYADAVTRVFLGAQLGCAQCHDHPFTDWKQEDFWGVAAFFAGAAPQNQGILNDQPAPPPDPQLSTISFEGEEYEAKFLWGDEAEIPAGTPPPQVFADWLTSRENPNFAANVVNRVWQHLMGRGLVADVDNLDLASEAERGVLLDELAARFTDSGYDLRWLISGICHSRAYQCPTAGPQDELGSVFSGRRPLKTLTGDQVFDSLEQALLLPVTRSNPESARHNGQRDQLVARLDEAVAQSPEEYGAGIPQVLLIMNGPLTSSATNVSASRTLKAVMEAPFFSPQQKIETMYLAVFTRQPSEAELEVMLNHVRSKPNDEERQEAYSEIFWALLNSPEFAFCR